MPSHILLFSTTTIVVISKPFNLNSTISKVRHAPTDNAFQIVMNADKILNSMSSQSEVEVKQIDGESEVQRGEESELVILTAHLVRTPVQDPLDPT
jgi:hypothetical protein